MAVELNAPGRFAAAGRDGAVVLRWDPVSGADGYRLFFYLAEEPDKLYKSRYSKGCEKGILGFINGKHYLAEVCAFVRENGREVLGARSRRVEFTPGSTRLKAQNVICIEPGESAQIYWEAGNRRPGAVFASDNTDVAVVNAAGEVAGKSRGHARITITTDDMQKFVTRVEVGRRLSSPENRAVLMFAGDIMCTASMQKSAAERGYDFCDCFRHIRGIISGADLAAAVLEDSCCDQAPFESEQRRNEDGSPNSNAPSSFIMAAAEAGFHGLITAANRSCSGEMFNRTVAAINHGGMRNIGTLGDSPAIFDVRGFRIAVIACTMITNSGSSTSESGIYSREYFAQQVEQAREYGAEFIAAYMHWGVANSQAVRTAQANEAHFMAEAGADIIFGSHPHMVQRFTTIKTYSGRVVPCAYSLGNLISDMDEMEGNRDGVILRAEIFRGAEGVEVKCSCIPVMTEVTERGAEVIPVFPAHSLAVRDSLERTRAAVGKGLPCIPRKPRVLLCGSEQLDRIFATGQGFRCSRGAMRLSQISLGCRSGVRNISEDAGDKLRLDLSKDISGAVLAVRPDYVAVDLLSAAETACFILPGEPGQEPLFFTDTRAFRQSEFYREHQDRLTRINPPFGDRVWKPLLRRYCQRLTAAVPSERIILFRNRFTNHSAKDSELRVCHPKKGMTQFLHDMEEFFISQVRPLIVDISGNYFTAGDGADDHEPLYYNDAYRAAVELTSGGGRTCISAPDENIWFSRVMKYYENMTERSYFGWLLDMELASDQLIAYTNAEFAAANRDRLLRLRRTGSCELSCVEDFFAGESGAEELVRAAAIIQELLAGRTGRTYDFYEPAFRGKYGIVRKLARLLSIESGIAVNEENAELVFLLRGKVQMRRYASSLRKMTVDIWGSSVSRESVNCSRAHIGTYICKQPAILAFDKPVDVSLPEGTGAFNGSRWRRRILQDALVRSGDADLAGSDSDWAVVDLSDLICRMTEYHGALFETDDFIRRTDFYKGIQDECRECWLFERRDMKSCAESIMRFGEMLKKKYGAHIILIKSEPKDSYIDLDHRLRKLETDKMFMIKKRFISLCEERFACVTGCYVIDISRKFYASDSFPLGGVDIIHYEDEFYRQAGAYISEIITDGSRRVFSSVDESYILLRDMRAQR